MIGADRARVGGAASMTGRAAVLAILALAETNGREAFTASDACHMRVGAEPGRRLWGIHWRWSCGLPKS